MFSLKKSLDRLDEHELRFQTAVDCYLAAILGMQEHAIEITPELTREHQHLLRTLHRDLFENRSVTALERSRLTLLSALEDYRARAKLCHSQREDDLRSMILTLAEAAETMSCHNETHTSRLKDFTEKLQATARGTDLAQMKRDLARQVAELRSTSQSIWRENSGSVQDIESKFNVFQQRLELAEKRATTDALTGLLNRGEGECRLRRQLESGKATSVMLIDVNGFKQINDRWGHSCGDQVLKVFSRNLEKLVRPSDVVCRWGGDEFLVFSQGNDLLADERINTLRRTLCSRYRIVALGKIFELDVSASLGVGQAQNGESVEEIVSRADTDMYQQKGGSQTAPSCSVLVEAHASQ